MTERSTAAEADTCAVDLALVLDALQEENQRAGMIFRLRLVEGLRWDAIATQMDTTKDTVCASFQRTMEILRTVLVDDVA